MKDIGELGLKMHEALCALWNYKTMLRMDYISNLIHGIQCICL